MTSGGQLIGKAVGRDRAAARQVVTGKAAADAAAAAAVTDAAAAVTMTPDAGRS